MLAAGLVPAASRWYAERQRETAIERQRHAVLAEAQAQQNELAANKPQLLAELGALQAAGEYEKVLALAGRYRLADDQEVRALYARSAAQVNLRQTLARMAELTQTQCTDRNAVDSVRNAFAQAFPATPPIPAGEWSATRLDTAAFVEPIRERVRALIGSTGNATAHEQARPGSVLDALRGDHPPRLHPAVLHQLMQDTQAQPALCAWRVRGTWATAGNPAKPFEVTLWLAPSATERTMTHDVLSLQGL
ncbi:hypothetical protein [Rudaea sp.]|uniref:hypothetical protein n=1 Tax=Rudaea sp. TaxID=2136325 RepID=UPI002ED1C1CB